MRRCWSYEPSCFPRRLCLFSITTVTDMFCCIGDSPGTIKKDPSNNNKEDPPKEDLKKEPSTSELLLVSILSASSISSFVPSTRSSPAPSIHSSPALSSHSLLSTPSGSPIWTRRHSDSPLRPIVPFSKYVPTTPLPRSPVVSSLQLQHMIQYLQESAASKNA